MKMCKRLLAVMNEDGAYLTRLEFDPENGQVFNYVSHWTDQMEHALVADYNEIKDSEDGMYRRRKVAEMLGAELVIIRMDYIVHELDSGELRKEYSRPSSREQAEIAAELFKGILGVLYE